MKRTGKPCGRVFRVTILLFGIALSGCSGEPLEIGREPALSPIGAGIRRQAPAEPAQAASLSLPSKLAENGATGSLWIDRGGDLFRDPRARRIGDILTVSISIKDKASFDNSSKRSRDSAHGFGLDMTHNIDWKGFASAVSAKADSAVKANTSTDGKGAIARSENIDLRIAAIVTGVLDNGNLVIEASQELRVNYELRVLTFSGIVNIADIKADNTISHERIAEARMSYGGRGRIMEVQQPGWGQQIVDRILPF